MPLANRVTLQSIPNGDAGTKATLQAMRRFAREGARNIVVREQAMSLVRDLPGHKNWVGQVRALHSFVRDCIQYVRDIAGVETLQTPEMTLRYRQGDCDDQATLLAALLQSIGHPARFVAISALPLGQFSHVYVETKIGARWFPLETTEKFPAGKPMNYARRMVLDV